MKHILIDFENTQPDAAQLGALSVEDCHIWLFLGATQKMLSADLCEALCRFGQQVHFVRVARSGKNALDFYLTYYLGKITEQDNEALICILSRDTGFDVLVEHLEKAGFVRGIVRLDNLLHSPSVTTTTTVSVLPDISDEVSSSGKTDTENNYELNRAIYRAVWLYLRNGKNFRPRMRHNLEQRLYEEIHNQIDISEYFSVMDIIKEKIDYFIERKFITVKEDNLLDYHFSLQDLSDRIVEYVRIAKPKKLQKLRNALLKKVEQFYLPSTDAEIDLLIAYCKKQINIYQAGQSLMYPKIDCTKEYLYSDETLQKYANVFLASYKNGGYPKNTISLSNALKNILIVDEGVADAVMRYMVKNRQICIDGAGKVTFTPISSVMPSDKMAANDSALLPLYAQE